MYSLIIVLLVLMARGGPGAERKRSSTKRATEQPADDAGSEYHPDDDDDSESTEEEALNPDVPLRRKGKETAAETEVRSKKASDTAAATRSKKKTKLSAQEKGKAKAAEQSPGQGCARPRRSGVVIREPGSTSPPRAPDAPIDPRRRSMYASKHCIGERWVGVANLIARAPAFQPLFEAGSLHGVSDFKEQTGYGLELIREFYMRAGHIDDTEGGPYLFTTTVRGVALTITPETIAAVLDMTASITGVDYLAAGFDAGVDWRRVTQALCLPGTESNGILILSKDLKLEYRYLNFVVCYNILPQANTKVIRWDRVLYMYLLGHPDICSAQNINLNIPFLIWRRMVREIKTTSQKDRLPYPMIIMRILRRFEVNVQCVSYERSLGAISDTTMAKSHVQLQGKQSTSSPPGAAPAPAPARSSSGSDHEVSISSVFEEQQRLSGELKQMSAKQDDIVATQGQLVDKVAKLTKKVSRVSRFLRAIAEKLGCGVSDLPSLDDDSD